MIRPTAHDQRDHNDKANEKKLENIIQNKMIGALTGILNDLHKDERQGGDKIKSDKDNIFLKNEEIKAIAQNFSKQLINNCFTDNLDEASQTKQKKAMGKISEAGLGHSDWRPCSAVNTKNLSERDLKDYEQK